MKILANPNDNFEVNQKFDKAYLKITLPKPDFDNPYIIILTISNDNPKFQF